VSASTSIASVLSRCHFGSSPQTSCAIPRHSSGARCIASPTRDDPLQPSTNKLVACDNSISATQAAARSPFAGRE
jgi:hypothetical protein